ncbi:MAG: hypothetical protein HQL97_17280 [Magnetococcales bacterium]|nr:hypothetical protein [Magnetococcales bacterium]
MMIISILGYDDMRQFWRVIFLLWVMMLGVRPALAERTFLETVQNQELSNLLNLAEMPNDMVGEIEKIAVYRMPVREPGNSKCDRDLRRCRQQKMFITHLDYDSVSDQVETRVFHSPAALEWRKPQLVLRESLSSKEEFEADMRVQEVVEESRSPEKVLGIVERNLRVRHREVVWQSVPPAQATRQLEEITDPEFKDLLGNLFLTAEYYLPWADIRIYSAWEKGSLNECALPDSPSCPTFRLVIAIRDKHVVWNNKVYILPKAIGGWHVKNLAWLGFSGGGDGYRIELEESYPNPDFDEDLMTCEADNPRCQLFLARPKVVHIDLERGYFE